MNLSKNKFLIIIVIFFLRGKMSVCQDNATGTPEIICILKTTAMKPINLSNGGFEFGIEILNGKRFSTEISGCYLLPGMIYDIAKEIRPKKRGYSLSAEEKFYVMHKAPHGIYVSLEFAYLRCSYTTSQSFGRYEADSLVYSYQDVFTVKKRTYSATPKFGYHFFRGNFSCEVYAGVGFRWRDVTHHGRINPNDEMISESPDLNLGIRHNEEGKGPAPSLPINIRLGYVFSRIKKSG